MGDLIENLVVIKANEFPRRHLGTSIPGRGPKPKTCLACSDPQQGHSAWDEVNKGKHCMGGGQRVNRGQISMQCCWLL